MSTKKIQILNSTVKQAKNADTLDGLHADEFATASDLMDCVQVDLEDATEGVVAKVNADTFNGYTIDKFAMHNEIDDILDSRRVRFENIAVASSAFVSDSTYSDFPYRASIALSDVTDAMIPDVIFSVTALDICCFAPVAKCYSGGIYIYADSMPTNSITIDTIICWR